MQIAPFIQGTLAHSLMLFSQFIPVNPGLHVQLYELIWFVHVAPFLQGKLAHSVMLISQLIPLNPG